MFRHLSDVALLCVCDTPSQFTGSAGELSLLITMHNHRTQFHCVLLLLLSAAKLCTKSVTQCVEVGWSWKHLHLHCLLQEYTLSQNIL